MLLKQSAQSIQQPGALGHFGLLRWEWRPRLAAKQAPNVINHPWPERNGIPKIAVAVYDFTSHLIGGLKLKGPIRRIEAREQVTGV